MVQKYSIFELCKKKMHFFEKNLCECLIFAVINRKSI